MFHPPTLKLWKAKRGELYEILPPIASRTTTKPKLKILFGRILCAQIAPPIFGIGRRKRSRLRVTKGTGYATYSAGGRGASAAGPEIPKEAGPRRRAQRRGARDEGGIPTRSMRPHLRTDARPYAERGIAGGAGMRRSAANAPRATAGCIGPNAERTDAKSRAPLSGRPEGNLPIVEAGGRNAGCAFRAGVPLGRRSPQIQARQTGQHGKSRFRFSRIITSDLLRTVI